MQTSLATLSEIAEQTKYLQRKEQFTAFSSAVSFIGPPAKQHSASCKNHGLSCPELKEDSIKKRKEGKEKKDEVRKEDITLHLIEIAPRQESLRLFLCFPSYSGLEDVSSRCHQGCCQRCVSKGRFLLV